MVCVWQDLCLHDSLLVVRMSTLIYLKNSSTDEEWAETFRGMFASASHVEFCVPMSVNVMGMHRRHVTYKEYHKGRTSHQVGLVCPNKKTFVLICLYFLPRVYRYKPVLMLEWCFVTWV